MNFSGIISKKESTFIIYNFKESFIGLIKINSKKEFASSNSLILRL